MLTTMPRTVATVCALHLSAIPAVAADGLTGVWARGDGKARVAVEKCGNDLCATNIWVKPGTRNERVGDRLIMDIEPVSENRYEGKARDERRKMTYSMEISLQGETMSTRGCILGQLICRSANWRSVQ